MALVMLGEEQLGIPVEFGGERPQLAREQPLLKQFFLEPDRDRHAERSEAPGGDGDVRL